MSSATNFSAVLIFGARLVTLVLIPIVRFNAYH